MLLIWGKQVVEKIDPGVGVWGRFSMSCLLSNVKDKFNWVFIGVYDPNDDRVSS